METPKDKLEKLKKIMDLMNNDYVKTGDFALLFKGLMELSQTNDQTLEKKIGDVAEAGYKDVSALQGKHNDLKAYVEEQIAQLTDKISKVKTIKGDMGYTPIKGKDYFDGEKGEKGDRGDDAPFLHSEDLRDRLELLTDDERLKASAVAGVTEKFAEYDANFKNLPNLFQSALMRYGGVNALRVASAGTLVSDAGIRVLNFDSSFTLEYDGNGGATVSGGGGGGAGVSLGGAQTGFTNGEIQYISQSGTQFGDTNFTRNSVTQEMNLITNFGSGITGGLITAASFAPVNNQPATFFYYGETPTSGGNQTNGVVAIVNDAAGALGTNDPAFVLVQSNNTNQNQVGVQLSAYNGFGQLQASSNANSVFASFVVANSFSAHGQAAAQTDYGGSFSYNDSNGNFWLDITSGDNPNVSFGDLQGNGNQTAFYLTDASQTFEFRGFGHIASDRIAVFNNANRIAKIGDVDFDWNGTLLTIDDIGESIFAGAIGSVGLGDTSGDPWVQASPSAGNAKIGDINQVYSGDKIIVQTNTTGGGGTTVYTGNGNYFIVEDLGTGNQSVFVSYNGQVKLGDLSGAGSSMLMDIDQTTSIWTMQNYGQTNFQSSQLGNDIWLTIQPYNNYVAMGDLSGTNNQNSFIVNDGAGVINSSTNQFNFYSAANTNILVGQVGYSGNDAYTVFGDVNFTQNGTYFYIDDNAQQFQVINGTVAANQQGFNIDFANSTYAIGSQGWGNNSNFTITDGNSTMTSNLGVWGSSGNYQIIDTNGNEFFAVNVGAEVISIGDLSGAHNGNNWVLDDNGSTNYLHLGNYAGGITGQYAIDTVDGIGSFSLTTGYYIQITYGDISGINNSTFTNLNDYDKIIENYVNGIYSVGNAITGTTLFSLDTVNDIISLFHIPTYANDAAATGAGLVSGNVYKTTIAGITTVCVVP